MVIELSGSRFTSSRALNLLPGNHFATKDAYNLRFPGQYYDQETGKHYNYFRDYDPAIGRYVESDPIGLRGGTNTYGYVGGSPFSKSDRNGLLDDNGGGDQPSGQGHCEPPRLFRRSPGLSQAANGN